VVPVGWAYNTELGTIDISGRNFAVTRKYRNVQANPRAAFVVDDVLPPFRPRCVTVQGPAEALDAPRSGGSEAMIRIAPDKITSWGLDERTDTQTGTVEGHRP
jgi:pyridoxamine 5'-phosphate oxidase family protein